MIVPKMVKNNDKLFLSILLIIVFLAHFTLYGPDLFACLFEDVCFYYHSKFYFIGIEENVYLKIYFETLSFYLILTTVFFAAYKLLFFTKSKFNNFIPSIKNVNLTKFINIFFLFFLIYFVIQNLEHFSSFENLIKIYRYKYDPQSLTILWLLGSISSWSNISLKKYFYSILIIIPVIFFLITDGSRLWVLILFVYCNYFLTSVFSISLKFILISSFISFGLMLIYIFQMGNSEFRIYDSKSINEENLLINNSEIISTSPDTSITSPDTSITSPDTSITSPDTLITSPDTLITSPDTLSSKNNVCDIELLKKKLIFLTLEEIEKNKKFVKNLINCESEAYKKRKFYFLKQKMQLDPMLLVYLPRLYSYEEKINFFDYTLFNIGLIKEKKFQEQNNIAKRIKAANNLNSTQSNINLSFYAAFYESYPRFYEKIFLIIIIGVMIYLLCFLMICFSIDILNIKYFILCHLIFIIGIGVTNHTRAVLKLLLFNNFIFCFILVIFLLFFKFKEYSKN